MGLTNTTLLHSEKFPVLVPNSLFSSQVGFLSLEREESSLRNSSNLLRVIVNKSRAQWRAVVTKIPLQIQDLDKILHISDDIKGMLQSNSKVFFGKEAPYRFLSHIESSYAELTVGCNLRHMSKDELYSAQQDILLLSVQIIKKHGATLRNAFQGTTSQ